MTRLAVQESLIFTKPKMVYFYETYLTFGDLLITFANSFGPVQDRKRFDIQIVSLRKRFFFKKVSRQQKQHEKLPSMQRVKISVAAFTLIAPITTAADYTFCYIFSNFLKKQGMILHDSHELSCLIGYF